MQTYRQAKPHADGSCIQCRPTAPGHQLCQHDDCNQIAEAQHQRHATTAEYALVPEDLKPIDGVCHQAVFTCLDHEPDPICGTEDHQAPAAEPQTPIPCPTCHAQPWQPCVKKNGKPRTADHPERGTTVAPTTLASCDHVHREDCGGQDHCECSHNDRPPERPKRIVELPPPPGPAPLHMPTFGPTTELLASHGVDMNRVLSLEIQANGNGGHHIHAVMAVLDPYGHHCFNDHGHLLTEETDVPFQLAGPTTPAKI